MSERNITAGFKTETQADKVREFTLVFADFLTAGGAPDPVRVSTLSRQLTWDSVTWVGLSDLLSVSEISETSDGQADQITVTLDGIPSTMLDRLKDTAYQGRELTVYAGKLDSSGGVVADPYLHFRGEMDSDVIIDDGTLSTMTITVSNRLSRQLKPVYMRFNHSDQKKLWPGETDDGFEFVAAMQDLEVKWGIA